MEGVSVSKSEWTLSAEALGRFLAGLDPDSDRAGEKYESLRLALMKFFDWRGAHFPEDLADETIKRNHPRHPHILPRRGPHGPARKAKRSGEQKGGL